MKKIIIDCDPGIDDAFLLFLADRTAEVEISAIVAVAGNVPGPQTYENARRLEALLRHDIPVYRGAQGPLKGEAISAASIHGGTGLGSAELAPSEKPEETEDGIDAMVRILRESEEPVTILAVGPLTDIALLLERPDCPREKIEQISIMGGGIKGGNWTMCAEFNIAADVEAADRVFRSGLPLVMSGLDVTERASITVDELRRIESSDPALGRMLDALSETRRAVFEREFEISSYCPNDTVALLALTNPELFHIEERYVEIVKDPGVCLGMTVTDMRAFGRNEPNAKVVLDVDIPAFREEMVRRYS